MRAVEDAMRGRVWGKGAVGAVEGEETVAAVKKFVICGNTEEKAIDRSDETGGAGLNEVENGRDSGADRLGREER